MNNYCINCGKYGHLNKQCIEPITSCGIICFNIKQMPISKIENFLYNKYVNIEEFNYKNIKFINKIDKHKDKIRFLLIQRKHSLSYIEFIRGRYIETDLLNIKYLLSYMSKEEVNKIKVTDFQILWDDLWRKTARSKAFLKELNISKNKFNHCKKNNFFDNLESNYYSPEWCFPKGRRNKYEKNLDCAKREFEEETKFTSYTILDRINFVEETFKGTNKIDYKHIYYFAGTNNTELDIITDLYEVGNIGWFTYEETINLMRPYELTKIDIIHQTYFFINTVIEKIKDNTKHSKISLMSVHD